LTKKFSKIVQKVGQILGSAGRKEKDIVDEWRNLCAQIHQNPADRLLMLLRFDLEQGGIDTKKIVLGKKYERIESAMMDLDIAQKISAMAAAQSEAALERETRFMHMLQAQRQFYENELNKMRDTQKKTKEKK